MPLLQRLLLGLVAVTSGVAVSSPSAKQHLGFARSKIIAIGEPVKPQPAIDAPMNAEVLSSPPRAPVNPGMEAGTVPSPKDFLSDGVPQKVNQDIANSVTNGVKIEDIIEQIEVYRYTGTDKPDPFIAPVTLVESGKIQSVDSEEIPIISPLQYFDLKSLKVTGVWETERNKWKAMIETPDQQGIIAKLQDPVGNSGGRITEISPNGILVREYKLTKDGTQEYADRMIPMTKESDAGDKFQGGKIILAPGAAAPQIKRPGDAQVVNAEGSLVDSASSVTPPGIAPTDAAGVTKRSDPLVPSSPVPSADSLVPVSSGGTP